MMNRPTWKVLVLALAWTCFATTASAMPSVDLFFTELNGAAIADTQSLGVLPGDQLGVEMRVTGDDRGVGFYNLSVDFDSAGTGRLLLDDFGNILALGYNRTLGPGPQGPGDSLGAPGMVRLFNATTWVSGQGYQPNPFTVNETFTVAYLEFTVTDGILGGPATITPGLFHEGVDEILSNELELIGEETVFTDISADFVFNGASLVVVPEPGTALLLGGGLLILARVRRRLGQQA